MAADGTCPTCGRRLVKADAPVSEPVTAKNLDLKELAGGRRTAKAPWHFKLLMVAVAAYLGFRAIQGVDWVLDRI